MKYKVSFQHIGTRLYEKCCYMLIEPVKISRFNYFCTIRGQNMGLCRKLLCTSVDRVQSILLHCRRKASSLIDHLALLSGILPCDSTTYSLIQIRHFYRGQPYSANKHCVPEGPSEQTETNNNPERSPFLDAGGKQECPEKTVEASLDWKPNGHTAAGPGNEQELSGPQRRGSTVMLPASPSIHLVPSLSVSDTCSWCPGLLVGPSIVFQPYKPYDLPIFYIFCLISMTFFYYHVFLGFFTIKQCCFS